MSVIGCHSLRHKPENRRFYSESPALVRGRNYSSTRVVASIRGIEVKNAPCCRSGTNKGGVLKRCQLFSRFWYFPFENLFKSNVFARKSRLGGPKSLNFPPAAGSSHTDVIDLSIQLSLCLEIHDRLHKKYFFAC